MQLAQAVGVELSARGDVAVLAADHPAHAGRLRELASARECWRARPLVVAEEADRLGEEAVAGEDRDVLAVDDVRRRPAAAQLVVVHRRQVVVDQRVGVDELDRRRGRQHLGRVVAGRARRRQAEHRADPLAAGEQRVAHRLVEARGRRRARRSGASARYVLDQRAAGRRGIRSVGGHRGGRSAGVGFGLASARSISLPAWLTSSAASRASAAACSSPISGSRSFSAIARSCSAMPRISSARLTMPPPAVHLARGRAEDPVDEARAPRRRSTPSRG